ncbi:hypothetical protein HG531_000024 [Fusarium graminearum]|nr:hypothetical protein HG531_000024 [Fusarium graminearum]
MLVLAEGVGAGTVEGVEALVALNLGADNLVLLALLPTGVELIGFVADLGVDGVANAVHGHDNVAHVLAVQVVVDTGWEVLGASCAGGKGERVTYREHGKVDVDFGCVDGLTSVALVHLLSRDTVVVESEPDVTDVLLVICFGTVSKDVHVLEAETALTKAGAVLTHCLGHGAGPCPGVEVLAGGVERGVCVGSVEEVGAATGKVMRSVCVVAGEISNDRVSSDHLFGLGAFIFVV